MFSPFLIFQFLVVLFLALELTTTASGQTSLQRIVFTSWSNVPRGWTKFDADSLAADSPKYVLVRGAPPQFRHILLTKDFTYSFSAPAAGRYLVRIGSIERDNCKVGKRGFQYSVNGEQTDPFSVSDQVGCEVPFFTDVEVGVTDDLLVTVSFAKVNRKRIGSISNIELFEVTSGPSTPPPSNPSPEPTASRTGTTSSLDEVERDVGPAFSIPGTTAITNPGSISTAGVSGVPSSVFETARKGMDFELKFNLAPGTYDVELGFAEYSECSLGARVFNVLINGNNRLESYDIFQAAQGCKKAVVERFVDQTIDPLIPEPFIIQFKAIASDAVLSFVRIKQSRNQCVPVTDDPNILADHLAHAVAGTYPPGDASSYVDRAGMGFVRVSIDGTRSHTHFSYDGKTGRVISYRWTLPETGKVLANKAKFERDFPLGTTRLKLTVVDDACSRRESETTISVTGNMQPGAYCYYYQGMDDLPLPGTLADAPLPTFAAVSRSLALGFPSFPFERTPFVARCIFSVPITKASENTIVSISTGNSGIARVYEGADLIIDSETTTESGPIMTSVGLSSFEVIYKHTDTSKTASLSFMMNGTVPSGVEHDQSTVLPIVSGVSPSSARIEGGARIKVSGYGLFLPLKVHFGSQVVEAQRQGATSRAVFALAPAVTAENLVSLKVESSTGTMSNALRFSYTSSCDDVKFEKHQVKDVSGDDLKLTQPTSVALWQDGKLYMGTRPGFIQVIDFDRETLVTKSLCHSEKLTDSRYKMADGSLSQRVMLGITFDPRDKIPRPYVSASTLLWEKKKAIDTSNKRAWSNGAIERFKPSTTATLARDSKQCLEYDRNIVSNLPVNDGDHSVNEIVFTQGGDLLIAVGGYTNMGLPHALQSGNWETYFSASVVVARLSKGSSFNGVIPYTTPENLRTAKPIDRYTDVQLYATGVRNLFTLAMARTGKVYALDNGPNCKYGNASSSCSEYVEADAALRSTSKFQPFPGKAIVGPPGECRYNDKRPDKLLEIKQGKFYGHSNLQRAIITQKPGECVWIDPLTKRAPPPLNAAPPSNYEPHMALVKSPQTGLREYGANLFCGKMRGDLILSKLNSRGVSRATLNNNGELDGEPFVFHTGGGLRIEENVHGDLLFPIYGANAAPGIFVMKPRIISKVGISVVNALPFRHGRGGGTKMTIGGWGFENGASIKVGSKNCPVQSVKATEIVCTVPSFSGGNNPVSVSVTVDGLTADLAGAVLYMTV